MQTQKIINVHMLYTVLYYTNTYTNTQHAFGFTLEIRCTHKRREYPLLASSTRCGTPLRGYHHHVVCVCSSTCVVYCAVAVGGVVEAVGVGVL